ncbi:MAG: tetratricopeptide repeat protein [Candidatus Heimdallarchaeota archaeon]|nr:MAG: tetratricopeptide repeat protein [Candidatus Heimdallarchaeota archaeon]
MSEELQTLFETGKYQEVLDQFTQKEDQNEWGALSEEEQIACIYYKSRSLEGVGRYEEALQTATMARATYPSPKNPSYLLALLAAQFHIFYIIGQSRLEQAQSVLAEGEAIMETLTDTERQIGAIWIAVFEHVKGLHYYAKNELDMSLKHYHKALKSFEALNNRHGIASCLFWKAYSHTFKGEPDTALEYYQRSLSLYEALGNKRGIGECLHDIGLVNAGRGESDTALEYFQRSLSLSEASGNPEYIFFGLTHIGLIYSHKGDPDKALDFFRQSLAVAEPLGVDWMIAYNFNFIGMAYHQKSALDIALPFFQSSLAKYETTKSDYNVVRVLFRLVLLNLDQKELEHAQKYLIKLQKVAAHIPEEAQGAHLRKSIAEALVLKQNPRMTEKVRAQALLRQIVSEVEMHAFTMIAIVALCDLLLLELKATGEQEVWEEAKTLIHQFHTKAQDSQDFNMVVNALLLRAKFATVEGELDQTQEYLTQARMIIKEKNLNQLMKKVEIEQNELENDFHKWQDLIQQHTSLQERLIHAQLTEYLQEAQRIVQRSPLKDD